ncbi:predicted metal-dependent hydrolase [Firmicutes bacterium CAG:270]|mgnify:FL=1|nr:predicted metal-dependent hydrolase [Firmicutes bacterium CAG:270]
MITQMGTIKIEIQRRKIKNMNIYIKPPKGDVLVTVPMRISDEEVFRFLKKKEQWILKNHEKMKNQKTFQQKEISIEQRKWLENKIIEYAMKWEPVMGVHCAGFMIRNMKTRWGSCSIHSKKIRINLQLAAKPEECIEYVLVHELCHLLEPSHNERFYYFMDLYLPDWENRKKKLNV